MNDPVFTHRYIREVLALRPDPRPEQELNDRQIFEGVKALSREALQVDEFRKALQWNLARRFIEKRHNDDLDQDVYKLTLTGKQKEGLA